MTNFALDRHPIDPASPDVHADNERLRRAGPLAPVVVEGVPAWAAVRYDALEAALTHPDLSRDARHWDPADRAAACPQSTIARMAADTSFLNAEGDRHRRLRAPLARAFTPRRVEALRTRVTEIAAGLVDELAPGPVDLRARYAYPLPRDVILELLGVPVPMRADVHQNLEVAARAGGTPGAVTAARARLHELLGEVLRQRRGTPGEDLITDLIAAQRRGDAELTAEDLLDTVELLLIAGHVTIVNLLTNAVRALLAHPGQLALVRSGESSWSQVVEECLRWDAPTAYLPMRYATRDLEIEGVVVRKGEAVLACYASAGRDPEHYGPRAGRFDLAAPAENHLSFGHGRHFCLGASLARLESEVALRELFETYPHLSLAVPPDRLPPLVSVLGNSVSALPVELGERAR
ncbi:cytochrome P450 family protein [Actinomadura macrotermitis]|uniref:Vitamin D(3) 25-hydroxylase n=1 Tax=Actinomadura macrotermitis TaxID=2585200 RepID=A0A7K0C3X6_9ACTN|nr:cytochrome P450 [Actinomadura macrotermitis]MQY08160.1 Vitamin D(3) 25-hydroxylase [Actinomadura macrotermitis]